MGSGGWRRRARRSVHLLHLADDLFLVHGQHGLVLPHFLKHHATIKLVTHLLEVVSAEQWAVGCEGLPTAQTLLGSGLPLPGGPSLPVAAFLGQQLLELAQGDGAATHQRAVGDGLTAEVIGHDDAVARLAAPAGPPPLGLRPVVRDKVIWGWP